MSSNSNNKLCFVIMPLSKTSPKHTEEYWTKQWKFLKKKIEECPGVEARRSEPLRGDIIRNIITDLYRADIVVADLTDKNLNVYWELGVRQSFKHGTITIAETRKHIPFDLSMKSTLRYYPHDSLKNEEFVTLLKKAIIDCDENPDDPDSHVLETLGGRGTIYQMIHENESIRRVEALLSETKFNHDRILKWYEQFKIGFDEVPTVPLCFSATELLVVNRYLDEDSEFYSRAEVYLNWIKAANALLPRLYDQSETTLKWFLGQEDDYKNKFVKFRDEIISVYDKFTKISK